MGSSPISASKKNIERNMEKMVTLQKIGSTYNSQRLEITGLSTDEKPTGRIDGIVIENGSVFKEIDTGEKYNYDFDSETWLKDVSGIGSQNAIESIQIAGVALPVENKTVNLEVGNLEQLGVVKSSEGDNAVTINEDGTMRVNKINIDSLILSEGDELILDGGHSS